MLNRLIHKMLFSNEVLPYDKNVRSGNEDTDGGYKEVPRKDLKYELDGLPAEQTYDHYKSKAL